ncbi:MAG: hypothetical protein KBD63_05025 [Bacteriovoracaceae bacterium]|nr:hypothetical protein [Bacteriovoracaceae bacterium]
MTLKKALTTIMLLTFVSGFSFADHHEKKGKRHEKASHHKGHKHGENCGHKAVVHGDHTDYEHEVEGKTHYHKKHKGHWDECKKEETVAPVTETPKA